MASKVKTKGRWCSAQRSANQYQPNMHSTPMIRSSRERITMSVQVACPICGRLLRVDERQLGSQMRCDLCESVFVGTTAVFSEYVPTVAEEELRAFVGPKASSYVGDWMSVLEGRKKRPAFNAIAFLFAGLWLPFRKLYGATAVFLGVLLVVNAMK